MCGNERPFALAPHQEVPCGQLVERFAHGALADAELDAQRLFAWQHVAGGPRTGADTCFDGIANFSVKWASLRRAERV
jgi:hypothetical protein